MVPKLIIEDYHRPRTGEVYGKRPATTRAELRVLRGLIGDIPAGSRILDVPCGNGRLAPFLRSLEPRHLVGADGSPEMLSVAAGAYDLVLTGDAGELPLADDAVDLAVCVRLLHHFRDSSERVTILGELARVARSRVVFSYYDSFTLQGLRRVIRGRRRSVRVALPASRIRSDLRMAGLRATRFVSLFPFVREQTFVLAVSESRRRIES